MRALVVVLLAVASASSASDKDAELSDEHKEFITTSVNLLGDCGGFFEFMADVFRHQNKPATGDQMHKMANGAISAASYLLSVEYAANHDKQKVIGEFSHYPQGRADANKTRLSALLEQEDAAAIEVEQKRCLAAVPLQNELVQQMRNASVAR